MMTVLDPSSELMRLINAYRVSQAENEGVGKQAADGKTHSRIRGDYEGHRGDSG
jgi:hypothetical protein